MKRLSVWCVPIFISLLAWPAFCELEVRTMDASGVAPEKVEIGASTISKDTQGIVMVVYGIVDDTRNVAVEAYKTAKKDGYPVQVIVLADSSRKRMTNGIIVYSRGFKVLELENPKLSDSKVLYHKGIVKGHKTTEGL